MFDLHIASQKEEELCYFTLLARNYTVLAYLLSFLQPKLQGQPERNDFFFGSAFQSKQTIPEGILGSDDRMVTVRTW